MELIQLIRKRKRLVIIIVVVTLFVASFLLKPPSKPTQPNQIQPTATPIPQQYNNNSYYNNYGNSSSSTQQTVKVYKNDSANFTMQIPSNWQLSTLPSSTNASSGTQTFYSRDYKNLFSGDPGPIGELYLVTIYPVQPLSTPLSDLQTVTDWGPGSIVDTHSTVLNNHNALEVKIASPANPPAGWDGQWCSNCTEKFVYIDLGNNQMITIKAFWHDELTTFEKTFDSILTTMQFTQ